MNFGIGVEGTMLMILFLIDIGLWVCLIVCIVGDVFFLDKLDIMVGFFLRKLFGLCLDFGWCMEEVIVIVVMCVGIFGDDGREDLEVVGGVCDCICFLLECIWVLSFRGFIGGVSDGLRSDVFRGVILVSVVFVVVLVGIWENVGCGIFIMEVSRGCLYVGILFVIRLGVRWFLGIIFVRVFDVGVIGRFWRGLLIWCAI